MPDPRPLVLDAGALIAYERADRRVQAVIDVALRTDRTVATSAAVVAQVWSGTARQARLSRLLGAGSIVEHALDGETARSVGARCTRAGANDVVDGHIAHLADVLDAHVLTGDVDDLVRLGVDASRVTRV